MTSSQKDLFFSRWGWSSRYSASLKAFWPHLVVLFFGLLNMYLFTMSMSHQV